MANRGFGNPKDHQSRRELLRWLLLVPIAFMILFGCGQLAVSDVTYQAAPDTRSKLRADYGVWPMVMIPAINPAIIEDIRRDENLNPTVIAHPFWPTTNRPTPTPRPTLIAQQPTATPMLPTSTPTPVGTQTPTPLPTRTATSYPIRTAWPAATSTAWPTSTGTPWPTATETLWPTATHRPPRPATKTFTPAPITPTYTATPSLTPSTPVSYTPTSTPTQTPPIIASDTPTSTPSPTPTPTSSITSTPTDTPAPTVTFTPTSTPTDTATPTQTATSTPTPTNTPQPCPGNVPPGEPNIGLPNGTIAVIQCGNFIEIDLGSQRINSHPGYDFVDYESYSAACGGICLDWVQVDVSDASRSSWVTVFNWGDGLPDNNTNVASYALGGEDDNEPILAGDLLNNTGITIDVDPPGFPPVPPSGYRYIRIYSPINWPNNDGAEVDSIEIVP